MSNTIGINENLMDNMILDLKDRIDLCSGLLNEIEDSANHSLENYNSYDKNLLKQKWQNIKSNYPTLLSNLETTTNDLVRAKNGYKVVDKVATTKVINSKEKIVMKEVKE